MLSHFHALRVGEINVGPAVAIVIDQRHSSAHRLRNIFCLGTRHVLEMDASGSRNVDQTRIVGQRPARLTLGLCLLTFRGRQWSRSSHLSARHGAQEEDERRGGRSQKCGRRKPGSSETSRSGAAVHSYCSFCSSARISLGWTCNSLYSAISFSFISLNFW